jgi:hypothetical protein
MELTEWMQHIPECCCAECLSRRAAEANELAEWMERKGYSISTVNLMVDIACRFLDRAIKAPHWREVA